MSINRQLSPAVRKAFAVAHVVGLSERWKPGGLGFHAHDRHQLIYASDGVVHVETRTASWVLPTSRALWIAAGVQHALTVKRTAEIKLMYVSPEVHALPPGAECLLVEVSPLLREVILKCATRDHGDETDAAQARLAGVLLDEAVPATEARVDVPLPKDRRARKVADLLAAEPGNRESADVLAGRVGASARTLMRVFVEETGMSFGAWRLRRRMLAAIELLADGETVTEVAQQVGYESTSSFVAAFHAMFGTTPSRYFR
ncbi:AraC family transcriptional regulator [Roseateles chitinivorans]|uniref:AraC family transcriptional regulator n=1 Tax=Roseateles chitinivorans TaxID=2917965 RepID=UPI003D669E82